MEKKEKSKIQVVDDGNPRGKNITIEEVKQAVLDLKSWFKQKAPSISKIIEATKPASDSDIKLVESKCNIVMLKQMQCMLLTCNGNFQLHDTFVTVNTTQMIDINQQNQQQKFWKKSYITFAQDTEKNQLVFDNDTGKVFTIGAEEIEFVQINDNIGLYIENLRNQALRKKLEFIEGCGLVETN